MIEKIRQLRVLSFAMRRVVAPAVVALVLAMSALGCNDENATVYPGAEDICGNGIDEDCSGLDGICPADGGPSDGGPTPGDSDDSAPKAAARPGCACNGAGVPALLSWLVLATLSLRRRRR